MKKYKKLTFPLIGLVASGLTITSIVSCTTKETLNELLDQLKSFKTTLTKEGEGYTAKQIYDKISKSPSDVWKYVEQPLAIKSSGSKLIKTNEIKLISEQQGSIQKDSIQISVDIEKGSNQVKANINTNPDLFNISKRNEVDQFVEIIENNYVLVPSDKGKQIIARQINNDNFKENLNFIKKTKEEESIMDLYRSKISLNSYDLHFSLNEFVVESDDDIEGTGKCSFVVAANGYSKFTKTFTIKGFRKIEGYYVEEVDKKITEIKSKIKPSSEGFNVTPLEVNTQNYNKYIDGLKKDASNPSAPVLEWKEGDVNIKIVSIESSSEDWYNGGRSLTITLSFIVNQVAYTRTEKINVNGFRQISEIEKFNINVERIINNLKINDKGKDVTGYWVNSSNFKSYIDGFNLFGNDILVKCSKVTPSSNETKVSLDLEFTNNKVNSKKTVEIGGFLSNILEAKRNFALVISQFDNINTINSSYKNIYTAEFKSLSGSNLENKISSYFNIPKDPNQPLNNWRNIRINYLTPKSDEDGINLDQLELRFEIINSLDESNEKTIYKYLQSGFRNPFDDFIKANHRFFTSETESEFNVSRDKSLAATWQTHWGAWNTAYGETQIFVDYKKSAQPWKDKINTWIRWHFNAIIPSYLKGFSPDLGEMKECNTIGQGEWEYPDDGKWAVVCQTQVKIPMKVKGYKTRDVVVDLYPVLKNTYWKKY